MIYNELFLYCWRFWFIVSLVILWRSLVRHISVKMWICLRFIDNMWLRTHIQVNNLGLISYEMLLISQSILQHMFLLVPCGIQLTSMWCIKAHIDNHFAITKACRCILMIQSIVLGYDCYRTTLWGLTTLLSFLSQRKSHVMSWTFNCYRQQSLSLGTRPTKNSLWMHKVHQTLIVLLGGLCRQKIWHFSGELLHWRILASAAALDHELSEIFLRLRWQLLLRARSQLPWITLIAKEATFGMKAAP